MFGSKKITKKAIHEIKIKDWEKILDKIYHRVVLRHSKALVIISNTKRSNPDDNEGSVSDRIFYRFKKDIKHKEHGLISSPFNDGLGEISGREIYNNIFKLYNDLDENKKFDFCHVGKKHNLKKDYMIYPLFKGLDKKAMIVFQYPLEKVTSNHVCEDLIHIFLEEN